MAIYLFWSQKDTSVFAFTSDPAGANLPADRGPWTKNGDGAVRQIGEPGDPSSIISKVLSGGYHIASIDRPVSTARAGLEPRADQELDPRGRP